MRELPELLEFDVEQRARDIRRWLRDRVIGADAAGYILGVSGGVDSTVAGKLVVEELGPTELTAIFIEGRGTTEDDIRAAERVEEYLGTDVEHVYLDKAREHLLSQTALPKGRVLEGNLDARLRMATLYAHANASDRLVLGTGNKSEIDIGYFTKYGDGGVDVLPLGNLYKTQVWELAKHLAVPHEIIKRPPSAGLWEGQTDEEEVGFAYKALDIILYAIESDFPYQNDDIAESAGVTEEEVQQVRDLRVGSTHKRKMPPTPPRHHAVIGGGR